MAVKVDRRLIIGGVAAFVAAAGAAMLYGFAADGSGGEYARLGRGVGDVALVDETGASVRWREFDGAPRAVFFGFTNCPVICPVTTYELNDALDRIGGPAEDVKINFVTIDPERDTAQRMQEYFSGFGPRVHGLTGEPEAIARLAGAFEVVYRRSPAENGAYTMDHTATVFLLDASGRVVDVVAYGTPPEVLEARLRALVGADRSA